MTTRQYSSRSQQSTLTGSISSGDTTMTVVSGTGLLGGVTIPGGRTFTLVIDPDTALEEIVDATAVSTNTFTITRAIDGSSAQAHSAGAVVRHMAIGRDFREANTHIENTTTAHGVTFADLVKTTDNGTVTSTMIANNTIVDGDINSAAGISDTKLNTISTALKVANSATTATSTNAASAIVARDGSGNFTAGTITADLTGTASAATLAAAATALATGRTIALTGDVTGTTGSFDGTGNATMTSAIAAGVIVDADVNASAAIDKTKIAGTAITAADTGTVYSAMIADDTIVNADISSYAAIAYSKLDLNGTITSADIVDGTIVDADINASAAIALSKLALDPLARANHTGTQTASTVSDFDTQVRTSRLDQMAAPTASVALNAQKITGLADPTDAQDSVTLNYITTQKGAVNGIASLDGTGLIPTNQLPALAITQTSVVASQAAMLALTAQVGDIAVRTDVNKSFILTAEPATTLGNWQELLTPTDSVLSVDGNTGAVSLSGTYLNRTTGQLLGNLDANSFTVSGLAAPVSSADAATKVYVDAVAGSATAAAASAAAAASSYDDFDDRYLGPKATPPTLDNDGNPLGTGALYWNTVLSEMYAWTGSAWGSISSTAAIYRYRFIAAGGETSVSGTDALSQTLAYLPGKEQVYLNGVLLVRTTDYTATDGTSITGLAALVVSDILEIITFTAFSLATAIENTIIDVKGDLIAGTAADTVGRLAVGTDTYILSANSAEATGLQWIANDTGDIEGVVTGTDSGLSGGVTSGTATLRLKLEFDAETGTTYTLVAGNLNQLVTLNNASAITLTVPPSVFSAGDVINIAQIGAGQVTLAEGAGVTITSTGATADAPALRAQYSSASIICTAADTFLVVGDIA
jgi:hypothetical protein